MSDNNPYTVPDGYFDSARSEILRSASRIRSRRRNALAAASLALVAVALFLIIGNPSRDTSSEPDEAYLAQAEEQYQYDYFLQIFE